MSLSGAPNSNRRTAFIGSGPSYDASHRVADLVGGGRYSQFEGLAKWSRNIGPGDTDDRRAQGLEAVLGHDGGQSGSNTAVQIGLVDHYQPSSAADGFQNHILIERNQRARIQHLDIDAFARERLGRRQRGVHDIGGSDHGDVPARSLYVGAAEGDRVILLR